MTMELCKSVHGEYRRSQSSKRMEILAFILRKNVFESK